MATLTRLQPFNLDTSNSYTFGNATITGNVTSSNANLGNAVTANYFIGNGALLTGIAAGSTYSNSNVAAYLPTYTGNISANYIIGNGSTLTFLTGANVNGQVANSLITGTVYINAQPNITSVGTLTSLSVSGLTTATGGIKVGNLQDTSGTNTIQLLNSNVSVTGNLVVGSGGSGNVTATYFIGNGSQLTGISGTYSNTNVAAYLPTYTGNYSGNNLTLTGNISTGTGSGNISGANYVNANYFVGNGSLLTGLPASYSNTNVAAYLPTYTGNFTAGNANITGNVTATYFIGNGSQLTGLPSSYANSNVAAYLPTYTGNLSANVITANSANINGSITTGSGSGNITGANYVNANYFIGNGSLLSAITGANISGQVSNALIAGTVYTNAQPNITSVGTLTSLTVVGDTTITGNLTVTGNYEYANVTSFVVKDPIIEQGGNIGGALTSNDGYDRGQLLHYYTTAPVDAFMGWDNSNAEFALGSNVSVANNVVTFNSFGNIRAGYFIGNGSQLTGISAGSTYSNSNVTAYLPTYTGNLSPGNLTVGTTANLGSISNVKIFGGSSGQVLSTDGAGNLSWANTTAFVAKLDSFTGNGVQTQFTLSSTPTNANYVIVMAGGIVQPHTAFSLSGSTLTFTSAPPAIPIEVTTMGGTVSSGSGGASASTVYGLSIVFGNGL